MSDHPSPLSDAVNAWLDQAQHDLDDADDLQKRVLAAITLPGAERNDSCWGRVPHHPDGQNRTEGEETAIGELGLCGHHRNEILGAAA